MIFDCHKSSRLTTEVQCSYGKSNCGKMPSCHTYAKCSSYGCLKLLCGVLLFTQSHKCYWILVIHFSIQFPSLLVLIGISDCNRHINIDILIQYKHKKGLSKRRFNPLFSQQSFYVFLNPDFLCLENWYNNACREVPQIQNIHQKVSFKQSKKSSNLFQAHLIFSLQ